MKGGLAWAAVAVPVALTQAGEHPAVRPSRDVAVTYNVMVAGAQGEPQSRLLRMYWTGQGTRLRLDMPKQNSFALIDFAASRMKLVIAADQIFLELPFDPHLAPGLNIPADVTMTPVGADAVAGVPCTKWDMKGPHNGGSACITQDGLVLRLRGGEAGQPVLEATSVAYGPQPDSLFAVPPAYKQVVPASRP